MIGQRKEAPDFLAKWEKEKKISSYRWEDKYTDGKDKDGNPIKVKIGTERIYGVTDTGTLEVIPKEIKEYFAKSKAERANIINGVSEEKPEEKPKKGK